MYAQLYTKTVYSLLKSCLKIDDYIENAKKNNIKAIAITDEANVYGLIKFYKACKKADIKPILGITVFINAFAPLILLAKNNQGYKHLLQIASEVQLNESSLMSIDKLKNFSANLIAIIPTKNNFFQQLILSNNKLFQEYLNSLKKIFNNNLYISLFPEVNDNVANLNKLVINKAVDNQIALVALNEVRYTNQEDAITLRYLEAISKGEKINSQTINLFSSNFCLLSETDFNRFFINYHEAVLNTNKIAQDCNVFIDFNKLYIPKYTTPNSISSYDYLKILCKKGLEKRLDTSNIPFNYLERLKYELEVISKMNYIDYFLIVYDFVKYAKQNNIFVGPGRGSSAGSLVSYVLGITNIDPVEYNLLFERFLNPERISLPDIDLDFQDNRRDEVIKYVQNKYGKNNVAHIITFGTFASRSAIREVAKVMDIKDSRINEIVSFIDSKFNIEDNIKACPELQQLISEYSEVNKLFTIAKKIETIPRNTATHAAGIIICEDDLRGISGLQNSFDDILQTQYEANDLEALGLLKMDFLGIRNLTAISQILDLIKSSLNIDVDLNSIPLNDAKTYRLIARGETTGIFQLESLGMRNVLQDIKASTFEDIVAVNALFRPGPMNNIPLYIARKNKTQPIDYLHTDLKPILKSTYGIIVYQEQIMMIAQKIAGYSLAQADLLRRAVSKKQKAVLKHERLIFIERAVHNGYDKITSETLYDYIVKFGDYGFNRSHSVAYALISYQMAYLKANYLTPFMVVMLTNVIGSQSQTSRYLRDCKRYGIQILPISINKSYKLYVSEDNNNIRMSFLVTKGIGQTVSEAILAERKKGIFKNYFDFVNRCQPFLKQNIFQSLVFVGALDEFKLSKKTMIENYDKIIDYCRFNPSGYFTDKIELVEKSDEYSTSELMRREKDLLGFYLTAHPISKYIKENQEKNLILPSYTLKYVDKKIELVGFVENIRKTKTKNNEEMATLTITDDTVSIIGVVFPSVYQKLKRELTKDHLFMITSKVQERNEKLQLVIYDMKLID